MLQERGEGRANAILGPPLPPVDGDAASPKLERWAKLPAALQDRETAAAVAASLEGDRADLLRGVFAGSPFLAECLLAEPQTYAAFARDGADAALSAVMDDQRGADLADRPRFMAGLRRTRRRVMLLTGLADLSGAWGLDQVTAALTELADLACRQALAQLLLEARRRGEAAGATPEACGLCVFAMGKHGAGELNYSSDIDLIVLFDHDRMREAGVERPSAFAAAAVRSLTYLIEHATKDGFVFRVDTRLRPHPPGHPPAISFDEALLYYERFGQNWERAALIKARPVAGDIEAGRRFLSDLRPFLWRRALDFAAIRDIHSIKRQINRHRGFGTIKVQGHDLKVGRGGIREIEFFAQTQQLILGGRFPELRAPKTLEALAKLARGRWIERQAERELARAYHELRALEHRLQMVADKQTQRLPQKPDELLSFARFCGFNNAAALEAFARAALETVEARYAALFEAEIDLSSGGSLSFTGTEDDPDSLETLRGMGFERPEEVSATLRAWHRGEIRATRSPRARELLTELTPALLQAVANQPHPDQAFALFKGFVAGLHAGVQPFSLFVAKPALLDLIADVTGAAPRLARGMADNPTLFEAMLSPEFFEPLPDADRLREELAGELRHANGLEDVLDLTRRWTQGRRFQAGLHVLLGRSKADEAGRTLAALAEVVVNSMLTHARAWLEEAHGRIEGGFAVLGMGKLGSGELTVGSDLDLVFVYEAPEGARSDGAKPLPAKEYFARLGQRLVTALSSRTAEGSLYEIDLRLRPSGNLGPPAVSLAAFKAYQERTAETWERQALTRARAVAGEAGLRAGVAEAVRSSLARPAGPATLAAEVRAMFERVRAEHLKNHEGPERWNLKHARGGIVALEFAAQFLVLAHAARTPGLLRVHPVAVFEAAGAANLLGAEEAAGAVQALKLQQALQAVLRLSFDADALPATSALQVREALCRAATLQLEDDRPPYSFEELEQALDLAQADAAALLDRLCPPTATTTKDTT